MTTDEVLSAFIDGELPPEEMEAVRRSVETNAALAARIAALKRADRLVAGAYRGIDDEPMPQSVLDLLAARGEAAGVDGSNVIAFAPRRLPGGRPAWAAALAASLALAVGLGLGLQLATGGAPSAGAILIAGVIEKGDPLYSALETAPSAETVSVGKGGASLTPVLTFRSEAGDYCREFMTEAGGRSNRGLACRQNDQWTVEFAVAATPQPVDGASYTTASSDLNAAFDSFVDELIADQPLAPEEEQAVIEAGWKAGR